MTRNQSSKNKESQRGSSSAKKSGQPSGGNFKNDPERAAEAGRKGGENSHDDGRKS